MALEINAQFKQFVQFARQQANPATSEAIARVTGTEDALAGRSISASNTDHTSAACSTGAGAPTPTRPGTTRPARSSGRPSPTSSAGRARSRRPSGTR